ncbi:helix-turn-helix transcriptional regulator [Acidiphilium cryptum]|uniref:Transcriptional regulator, XRE family n=1 Tax=Acidiphilium cryptum (strain JF-5) TaxID=349163 RepID=A5FTN2_ACICJ|nr:helix-turn-helix transcriptional regulator [Acidiphilium cryptum]ABQ28964.1 transcriptional regulator, XRE family [Acidiphilium cryptum JF-5]
MIDQESSADLLIHFGQLIRKVRISFGVRQADLAAMVGTRQATISELERGRLNIHLDLALNLMRHLGIEIREPEAHSDDAQITEEAMSVPDIDNIIPPPSRRTPCNPEAGLPTSSAPSDQNGDPADDPPAEPAP